MRFAVPMLAPFAVLLALPAPARAAEVLILESSVPAYPAGLAIDDATPVSLRRAERLIFIGADGVTREVVGAFEGALGDEEALEENRRALRRGVWSPISARPEVVRPDPSGRDNPVGAVAGIGGGGDSGVEEGGSGGGSGGGVVRDGRKGGKGKK